uniref:Pilus assembly protein TadG-related protein n=1 Tax=Streptomyces sp. NBC_00049 TaxID=2903617 RepID=A0AAU2JUG2_9ACTN
MHGAAERDRGQTFPFYIVMIMLLLFAAFAFVAVGMAGATRSEAQGAADAAALAAAREVRDNAFGGVDFLALTSDDWNRILLGRRLDEEGACAKGVAFASLNDAEATCQVMLPEVSVSVTTNGTVGDSVIPGTESMHARATAKAVIEPRCWLISGPTPTPAPSPTPTPGDDATGTPPSVDIRCKGGATVTVDPTHPGTLTTLARKLFGVRLAD